LLQDKERIIENLMLRYDLGLLTHESSQATQNKSPEKVEDKELRRKAEVLAQRTILENFELRELVNELRDENFHLRNEIHDLQDTLNRQALHITKLAKSVATQNQADKFVSFPNYGVAINGGMDADAVTEEAQRKHEERTQKHNRRTSSIAQPSDFWQKSPIEEAEKLEQDMTPNSPPEESRHSEEEEEFMDEEAKRKHKERQTKAHEQNSTLVTPQEFFTEPTTHNDQPDNNRPNKRRGSKQLLAQELKNTEEAIAKRQERHEKEHSRKESTNVPSGFFESDHVNSEEAKKIREERARKARKESVAVPKNFLTSEDPEDSEDEVTREKRRKHQRKQSVMKAVGDKGHLSDEDTEKTQQVEYETRRKGGKQSDRINNRQKPKDPIIPEHAETTHHRRESSLPNPDLGFENPAVLLAAAEDEVKKLKEQLSRMTEERKMIENQLQNQLQKSKQEARQIEEKLGQQLEKRIEEKFEKSNSFLMANNKKEIEQMTFRVGELEQQLNHAATSKMNLIQCTNAEINRLNRVVNTLLQSDKCKEITRLLLNDNTKKL